MNVNVRERMRSARTPRLTKKRRPVEVQHASRGVKLMLRRGLHGSKNWALEPEEDGTPRTPAMKALRFAVLAAPLLVMASGFTAKGTAQGEAPGVFQSLLMAVVVTLAGLAWFSARERRMGREEPWADLEDLTPESDHQEPETQVLPKSEDVTEVISTDPKGGVVEETPLGDAFPEVGKKDESEEKGWSEPPTLPPPSRPPLLEKREIPELEPVMTSPMEIPSGSRLEAREEPDQDKAEAQRDDDREDPETMRPTPSPVLPEEGDIDENTQVREDDEASLNPSRRALDEPSVGHGGTTTESDMGSGGTWRDDVGPEAPPMSHENENPQVSEDIQAPASLDDLPVAPFGPILVGKNPVSDEWFLEISIEQDEEKTEDEGENTEEPPLPTPIDPGQTWEQDSLEVEVEAPAQEPPVPSVLIPYFAAQITNGVMTDGEKEEARNNVIEWARKEVLSGHRSQAEIVRLTGASSSTVSRWIKEGSEKRSEGFSDPWEGAT